MPHTLHRNNFLPGAPARNVDRVRVPAGVIESFEKYMTVLRANSPFDTQIIRSAVDYLEGDACEDDADLQLLVQRLAGEAPTHAGDELHDGLDCPNLPESRHRATRMHSHSALAQ